MIGSTRAVRVFAYTDPVDMRKGFNGLEGIVRNELGHDLTEGDLSLFVAKNRKRAKVLLFDGTGLCIFMKRIEVGSFGRFRQCDGELRMSYHPKSMAEEIHYCSCPLQSLHIESFIDCW